MALRRIGESDGIGGVIPSSRGQVRLVSLAAPANTVAPVVSGIRTVGQTLSLAAGTWTNLPAAFTYQWQSSPNGSSGWANIGGATNTTLLITSDLATKYVRCAVSATNGAGASAANSNSVGAINAVLAISGTPATTGQVGQAYATFTPTITGGRAPYTVSMPSGGLPSGLSLNTTTGAISGTPTAGGEFAAIILRVTDADGLVANLAAFTLTVVSAAPTVSALPMVTGITTQGQTLTATTGTWNGAPTAYAFQWKRNTVAIGGATASTYVLAAADVATEITVTVTATNGGGNTAATSAATATIAAVLSISGSPATTGTVGTAYSFTPTLAGGRVPRSVTLTAGVLPAGLSLNATTGALTGSPTTVETRPGLTLRVTDADGLTATLAAFQIAVSAASGGTIALTGSPSTVATIGQAYSFTPTRTGGTAPFTYSMLTGTLPAGITLNTSTGVISGTPTTSGVTALLVLRVTDGVGSVDDLPNWTITTSASPSYIPSGWVVKWQDTFQTYYVNEDETLTDAGIQAQKGVWGYSNLWYQNVNENGIPGFGRDWAMNPLAPSATPAAYKRSNPLGTVEFPAAGQLIFVCRPSTAAELAVIPTGYTGGLALNGGGGTLGGSPTPWQSACVSTRFKCDPIVPFASVVRVKLPGSGDAQFPAIWRLLTGPRARFPGTQNTVAEWETDELEVFNDNLISRSYHGTLSGAYTYEGGLDTAYSTGAIDEANMYLDIVTIYEATQITVKIVMLDGTVLDNGVFSFPGVPAGILSAYQTYGHHLILNNSCGIPWTGTDPTNPLLHRMTIAMAAVYAPVSNTSVPAIAYPPNDTTLTFRSTYVHPTTANWGRVMEDVPVGTVIADFAGSATAFRIRGGDGKFSVSGSTLVVAQVLNYEAFTAYRIFFGGTDGATGYGYMPEITIAIGDVFEPVNWFDAAAELDLNYETQEVFEFGVQTTWSTWVNADLTHTAAFYAKSEAAGRGMVFRGFNAVVDSTVDGIYGTQQNSGLIQIQSLTQVSLGGPSGENWFAMDSSVNWALGLSWGTYLSGNGVSLNANGGTERIDTAGRTVPGSGPRVWGGYFPDRPYTGTRRRLTIYRAQDLGQAAGTMLTGATWLAKCSA